MRKKKREPDLLQRDLVLLGEVLRRFLQRECPDAREDRAHFFFHEDRAVLDGSCPITQVERRALLRTTSGEIDATGLRRAADPETYKR